ncbi:putative retrotransposon gag domain-containing protein [Helianthus debilis subsp. tardiflorus]
MADGTRARVMEDTVKDVQENQKSMRLELDAVVTAIGSLQHSINELIKRSDAGTSNSKKQSHFSPTGFTDGDGSSIIGRHKPALVYLARFNDKHPERWLAQASHDAAADWYDWLQLHQRISTWDAFTEALTKRFRPNDLEKPEGLLAKLQQTSTVADYQAQFEAISNRTMPLPVGFLVSCWISGLRFDIK